MEGSRMKTEWGYFEENFGYHPTESLEVAERATSNMNRAGMHARVVWRGVTEWQERDNFDD